MKNLLASLVLLFAFTSFAAAQENESIISMYRIAPGKHLEFLKWLAEAEAIAKEAGAPASQWYVHHNGDSWDFVTITPQLPAAQQEAVDKKIDEISMKKGRVTGLAASLKAREFFSSHTDTYAGGPYTAGQLVKMAEGK